MPELDDLASVHRRRSIRLRDFDYATHGAYFVTLVTHERVNSSAASPETP